MQAAKAEQEELKKLKAELKRVTQECDILKEAPPVLHARVEVRYRFIQPRQHKYPVTLMCRVLQVHRNGFHAWQREPLSHRAREDQRLGAKIKRFWMESGCNYGYRNITLDLQEAGETCGKNRVLRLMRKMNIASHRRHRRHKCFSGGVSAA